MIRVDQENFIQFINDQLDMAAQEDVFDQCEESPHATIADIMTAFIDDCAADGRLPTLEEAQTLLVLHSIIEPG